MTRRERRLREMDLVSQRIVLWEKLSQTSYQLALVTPTAMSALWASRSLAEQDEADTIRALLQLGRDEMADPDAPWTTDQKAGVGDD